MIISRRLFLQLAVAIIPFRFVTRKPIRIQPKVGWAIPWVVSRGKDTPSQPRRKRRVEVIYPK